MPAWIEREVLITVKAYPEPSATYKETVCTAGVSQEDGWLRLYPIRFRQVPRARQFRKYQLVRLRMAAHERDGRPESFRPDEDSITPGRILDTRHRWAERKAWVLPFVSGSMCEIRAQQRQSRTSLGAFKPRAVKDLKIIPVGEEWTGPQKAKIEQLWFDDLKGKSRIEKIPYVFRYGYLCEAAGCRGHEQSIIDWELMQLCRKLASQGASPKVVQEKIKQKFLEDLCGSDKETYFFVGNHSRHRSSFMVLGVFYPPKAPPSLFPAVS